MLFHLRSLIRRLPAAVIKMVPLPDPVMISGFGVRDQMGSICQKFGFQRVLLITDQTVFSLSLHEKMTESLENAGISYTVFSEISSEPNLSILEKGRKALADASADAIIALGGGAVMDSSKMIAAGGRLNNKKTEALLQKFLFVRKKTLPLLTVPTTAGTGAEITVGAVVTNPKGQKSSTVIFGLDIPCVILDSELTLRAPKNITCACGIDALSHGLEGVIASAESLQTSMECVKLVLENLPILIADPGNIGARQNMCLAANYGGIAINRQLAGYVHAFAHSIGAKYHISHGNAIAMCLIPVLNCQKESCRKKLSELAIYCGYSGCEELILEIEKLITLCDFPEHQGLLKKEDYKALAREIAFDSINYSAPVVFNEKLIFSVLDEINQ